MYALFYKKVIYKKVVLDWPKPQEIFNTSSTKLRSKRSSATTAMTSDSLAATTSTPSASNLPVSMANDVSDGVEIKDRMIKNPNPKIKSKVKKGKDMK